MCRPSSSILRFLISIGLSLLLGACEVSRPGGTGGAASEAAAAAAEVRSLYQEWRKATEDGPAAAAPESVVQELNARFAELLEMDAAAVARLEPELAQALGRVRTLLPDERGSPPNNSARIGDRYYDASGLEAVLAALAPGSFREQELGTVNTRAVTVRAQGPLNPRDGTKTVVLLGESTTKCVPFWTSWGTSTTRATRSYDLSETRGPGLCPSGPVTVRSVEVYAHMLHQDENYHAWSVSLHPRELTASRSFHRGLSLRTLASIESFSHPATAKPLTDATFEYEVVNSKRSNVCTLNFDDGTSEQVDCGAGSATHSYAKAGTYKPSMVVTDASGRVLDTSDGGSLEIHSGIAINSMTLVGTGLLYPGDPVRFALDIANAGNTPLECEVNWGDGNSQVFDCTSSRTTPSHAYTVNLVDENQKFYDVLLDVRDATDSRASTYRNLVIFSHDFRPAIDAFTFNGQSVASATVESGESYRIAWEVDETYISVKCEYIKSLPEQPSEERTYEVPCSGSQTERWVNPTQSPVSVRHTIRGWVGGVYRDAAITVSVQSAPLPTASASFADSQIDEGEPTAFTVRGTGSGITCERRIWNDSRRGPGDFYGSSCSETVGWTTDREGEWKLEFRVTDEHGRIATASDTISVAVPESALGHLSVSCREEVEGQSISCDAEPEGWLEPGTYLVSATALGYDCTSRSATVVAGETVYLTINCR